ncbi:MAG: epoxide hydrolase [Gammaproteobacteria bacterium]|nr:epoxide hydrolase [Gammaproteobacteria bacterium]
MTDTIVPFQRAVEDGVLKDLKQRLQNTRWPDPETTPDWSQGIPLDYVKEVCAYWAADYDWRATEERINRLAQFKTDLDGVPIHFVHMRSPHDDALPLVMTHGWPGSIVEFLKVIEPLCNPTAHGGSAQDAFHVICPALPGYGFSGKPASTGWGIEKIARQWAVLMNRLGYDRYVAQGGDWGAAVTTAIGLQDTTHCAAIHLNMPIVIPDPDTMNDLTELEKDALAGRKHYRDWDSGYSKQQSTRPQTVAYGLADSPSGQAAWILEKFWAWMDCDGHPENVLTRDELLDNIMFYWVPGAAGSSARLYWESFGRGSLDPVEIPVGCSMYPKEIFRSSRRWAEKRFPKLIHWNELERGGHFAAFERPDVFVDEIRTCFRHIR